MTSDSPRLRLGIVAVVALSCFAALLARAYYLQVLASSEYKLAARANTIRTVLEPAPRGQIKDRNGVLLVGNRASNVVAIDRARVDEDDLPRLLDRLGEVLRITPHVLGERLRDATASPYTPVPVADGVDEPAMIELRERQDELVGVVAEQVAVRDYPFGSVAAHVLGYVGEINAAELETNAGKYQLGDVIGKAGVEQSYESQLRGTPGVLRIEVDANGKPVQIVSRKPPVQGNDLILSLDVEVQRVAEDALAQGLQAAGRQRFEDDGKFLKADAGAAVVLDAKEGSVLAMASYPTFDLPGLADGVSNEEYERFFKSTGSPFTNRVIAGHYAPGSTWKLVTADAALRSGLITPGHTIDDTGTFTSADCEQRKECTRQNAGRTPWGLVDIRKALAVSSDVFFYDIGDDFWVEWARTKRFGQTAMQDVAAKLGFGAETGVPLSGESAGRVPTPEIRAQLHDRNPVAFPTREWYQGDNVSLAIGQGELDVTPIQVANAYATYANGGVLFQPNLVLRVERQDGRVVETVLPREAARVDLPPHVRNPILDGLAQVLTHEKGTGRAAFAGFPLDRYRVAGKTGTAQAPPKQDTAWFVGVGPLQDPRHAVAVVMEQSGFGSKTAAPVSRKIFARLAMVEDNAGVAVESGAAE